MDAQSDPTPAAIPSAGFSTRHLPARDQFEAYRADALAFAELTQPEGAVGCPAHYTAWLLGPLVVKVTDAPPLDQQRTPAMARRDGLDHRLITLPRRGALAMDLAGQGLTVTPARPTLLACHQPYRLQRPRAEEDWMIAFVARDALPGLSLPPGLDGVAVLASPMGRILTAHLRQVAQALPELTLADAPALRDATLALLRATLASGADHRAAARPHAEAVLRERLRRMIRARLGAVTLTPERLVREAGLSRTSLYRLFEPLGGVAATIQAERLAQARSLLEAPGERRTIRQIGEAVGFFDPSVFSRAFRRRYGAAPRELREAAQEGRPVAVAGPAPGPRGFLDMVARIEA